MLLAQKERILLLRSDGHSYARISKETGVSVNTIKSLCRREKSTSDVAQPEQPDRCKQCGKPLLQTPGHRQKQFCCTACRMQWWKLHHKEINQKTYNHVCRYCGKPFTSIGGKPRVYCSRECYIKAVAVHE